MRPAIGSRADGPAILHLHDGGLRPSSPSIAGAGPGMGPRAGDRRNMRDAQEERCAGHRPADSRYRHPAGPRRRARGRWRPGRGRARHRRHLLRVQLDGKGSGGAGVARWRELAGAAYPRSERARADRGRAQGCLPLDRPDRAVLRGLGAVARRGAVLALPPAGPARHLCGAALPGTEYLFEILAIEDSGNKTITEGSFESPTRAQGSSSEATPPPGVAASPARRRPPRRVILTRDRRPEGATRPTA
jgi:hypothetical protein